VSSEQPPGRPIGSAPAPDGEEEPRLAAAAPEWLAGFDPQPGEYLVAAIHPWLLVWWPYYLAFGLGAIWRRRHYLALTNQRLVYAKGVVLNKVSRSVPLSRVQDATYARRGWAGGVAISSAGGSFGNLSDVVFRPAEAKAFVYAVNQATQHSASAGLGDVHRDGQREAGDVAEAMRTLARLRDEGLISEAEYEAKRRELLARM